MTGESVDTYYALRAAQHYFDKSPDELSEEQQLWLKDAVKRQQAMESQVLSTPQAAQLVVPDEQIKQAMDQVQSQYDDVDGFLDALGEHGLNVSQLSDLLERQLLVDLVLEQQAASVEGASIEEAREYYNSHPQKFAKPERRKTWHLLITIDDKFAENSRQIAVQRLEKIRAEATGDLKLFKMRARRYSECPSALSEGELGWIPRGHLFPQIDDALFQLSAGDISAIVETEVGLHLVFCEQVELEATIPFASVAETIQQKLTEAKQQQAQRAWLRSLS